MHVRRYTAREVATAIGLSLETVRRAIRRGELASINPTPSGRYHFVTPEALRKWMRSQHFARALRYSRGALRPIAEPAKPDPNRNPSE